MTNRAYLSLGSNIAPETNIVAAVEQLARRSSLLAVSSVWETVPIGVTTSQPNFLNAVVLIQTPLSAEALKYQLLTDIEQTMGRVRHQDKYAPRTIDIDIMLFNQQILTIGVRKIPNTEIMERAFVAIPLAEVAPDYQHPQTKQTLREIARCFDIKQSNMILREDVSTQLQQMARPVRQ
ncbi:2-amino-4-hydroxy-6-hydroxymethyldihydropteridine diphosphokinase [Anaerolineales bacterium HSG6]|nr:2-amino-4-hydroxy-6-hydroxymethyldihydropteridine diphosphokinase [Anaerolineales bacterium HSG6]MDM8530485.1 2-amino-4-hydroxy-6-hydroxymethyldihydropteridine diphosphokinase [Anaerolineales bacterium HSG25]